MPQNDNADSTFVDKDLAESPPRSKTRCLSDLDATENRQGSAPWGASRRCAATWLGMLATIVHPGWRATHIRSAYLIEKQGTNVNSAPQKTCRVGAGGSRTLPGFYPRAFPAPEAWERIPGRISFPLGPLRLESLYVRNCRLRRR